MCVSMRTHAYAHRAYARAYTQDARAYLQYARAYAQHARAYSQYARAYAHELCAYACAYTQYARAHAHAYARAYACVRTRHIPIEPSDRTSEATATFIKVFLHKTTNSGDLKNTITFLTRRTIWKAGAKDVKVRHKCYEHSTPYQLNSPAKQLS